VRSGPGENQLQSYKKKVQWSAAKKQMNCDEPQLAPNEKTQPI